jgi:CRP-like cAMP-binding protein
MDKTKSEINKTSQSKSTLFHVVPTKLKDSNDHDSNKVDYENNFDIDNTHSKDRNGLSCQERVISKDEEDRIKYALKQHFLFDGINDEILFLIFGDLVEFKLDKGEVLFEENDEGNNFYIVKKGIFETFSKGSLKGSYGDWDCIGDMALIHTYKRTETVIAKTEAEIFILNGSSFREILVKMNEISLRERLQFFNNIPAFNSLGNGEKHNLVSLFQVVKYEQGDKIIKEGDLGDKLHIIKEGCVSCRFRNKEVRKLYEKDYFGQNSILYNTKRSLDVLAISKTICYELSKRSIEEALGLNFREVILFAEFNFFVKNSFFFKEMVIESKLDHLFKSFQLKMYKNGQVVSSKDDASKKKLILVVEGNLINVLFINS